MLCPKGLLTVYVPYGLKGLLLTPYHVRAFTLNSFDNILNVEGGRSLERVPLFDILCRALDYGVPFKWHIHKYLGFLKLTYEGVDGKIRTKLPLGTRREIIFILRKKSLSCR